MTIDKTKGDPLPLAKKRLEMQIQEKALMLSRFEVRILELEEEQIKIAESQDAITQDKANLENELKNLANK